MKVAIPTGLILLLTGLHGYVQAEPSHGISAFGDLKYPSDFTNFNYVNPNAPKGGTIRLRGLRGFDTINPFTLKGIRFRGRSLVAVTLPYDTLMATANDEPDSMYGLVAEWADIAKNRTSVTFKLRPEAQWHDGKQITPEDVVFSFDLLREKGAPRFRIAFEDVLKAEVIDSDKVRFRFDQNEPLRDLPLIVASMPILSKEDIKSREFNRTSFVPLLGSGPYRIVSTIPNRTITLQRVQNYWGSNLPVNRGRHNFREIRVEFYRDRDVAHEAFKAGEFDFQEEFTSRIWATGYNFPAIQKKKVVKESLPNGSPAARQYFVLNLRRKKFDDVRIRRAFNLTFDFEWTNKNLFYGLYRRSNGIYSNTIMSASQAPDQLELDLFEKFPGPIPKHILDSIYEPPHTNGSGDNRRNLQEAQRLLSEAGWHVKSGKLVNAEGDTFVLEFLLLSPSFERITAPIIKNLERIGIKATMRVVDPVQYTKRVREEFDFDVTTAAFGVSPTPGVNERAFWHSSTANISGGANYGGIKDPIVDYLLENLASATDRQALITSARALDRTLMANLYVVPQWYRDVYTIAYWNIFGRPKVLPTYSLGMIDTWWIDQEKAALVQPSVREQKD